MRVASGLSAFGMLLVLAVASNAVAQTVNRCSVDGRTVFQHEPCPEQLETVKQGIERRQRELAVARERAAREAEAERARIERNEGRSEGRPDATGEARPVAKPEAKLEAKPEPKIEPKPEPKAEPRPDASMTSIERLERQLRLNKQKQDELEERMRARPAASASRPGA